MRNKYASIKYNDTVNGEGICVSFWVQGCPHHCKNCFNPETWDFDAGKNLPDNFKEDIISAINKNGINRNFSILGGEPLCKENLPLTADLVQTVRNSFPNIKIFIWTGYLIEELNKKDNNIQIILNNIDILIDGEYIEEQRDITLKLRGSKNQRILVKGKDF